MVLEALQEASAAGDEDAATGHEGWDRSLAKLRSLQ